MAADHVDIDVRRYFDKIEKLQIITSIPPLSLNETRKYPQAASPKEFWIKIESIDLQNITPQSIIRAAKKAKKQTLQALRETSKNTVEKLKELAASRKATKG